MSNNKNEVICTICLESLKESNFNYPSYIPSIISLSCSHSYHFNCICSWFTKSCSFLCPICKYQDCILIENFLPEIKNLLHNEILKSSRDFLTNEEYEKYCEDCIKQGNMLKLIEEQQRKLNSQNESIHDNYYNDNDNYQSSIEQEYYNSDLFDTEFHNDLFNTEMLTEIGDNQDDLDCNDSRYYIRRGYVFSDEEEEEDETITYARGVINCILDDEEEKEHLHRFKNEDRKIITDKYDYDHKILKKKNYQRFNQKSLEGFLKVLSNEKENDREEDISYDEKYENILLNTNPKPSFMHKYRFYIISIILFTIGYFLFL